MIWSIEQIIKNSLISIPTLIFVVRNSIRRVPDHKGKDKRSAIFDTCIIVYSVKTQTLINILKSLREMLKVSSIV